MAKAIYDLTSNQYYGGINRRCQNRLELLRKIGFEYDAEAHGWFHPRGDRVRKGWRMPMCMIQHADKRSFFDTLKSMCNR